MHNDFYFVYGEDGADYIAVVSNAAIKGGPEDDTIYCTGYECAVNGNEGDDEINIDLHDVGSTVHGGIGNDEVFGKGYYVNGEEGNDYLSLDSAVDLKGGEGDDVLEVLAPSWDSNYNGGPGADTFNCSPGPGDIVEDYNPEEGDTVTVDCETVQDTNPRDVEITKSVDKKDKEVISDSSTTKPRSIHMTFEATDVIGIDRLEFSLDGQAFSSCMGPVTYEKLRTSLNEFTAISREGNRKHPKRQVYRNCHKVTLRLKSKKEDSHSLASRCFSLSFNNL